MRNPRLRPLRERFTAGRLARHYAKLNQFADEIEPRPLQSFDMPTAEQLPQFPKQDRGSRWFWITLCFIVGTACGIAFLTWVSSCQ